MPCAAVAAAAVQPIGSVRPAPGAHDGWKGYPRGRAVDSTLEEGKGIPPGAAEAAAAGGEAAAREFAEAHAGGAPYDRYWTECKLRYFVRRLFLAALF
jgi:hypothetical protein